MPNLHIKCEICGIGIATNFPHTKYCGPKCRRKAYLKKPKISDALYERARKWRIKNKEHHNTGERERYYKNHEKRKEQKKIIHRELKKTIIAQYGGKCKCCGEKKFEFLTIDHIEGGGAEHRKKVGNGIRFYYWIRKNKYPKGLRVLCWNCNCSLGVYGYCPHKNKKV